VYLWMDADGPGQEGAAKFAKKLGERRVAVVRPLRDDLSPAKDANEALLAGKDLQAMLDAAAPLPHEDILLFRGTQ
jgi:twinkle protein